MIKGFPDGMSDCKNCVGIHCNQCNKSMPKRDAHDPNLCGYENLQENFDNGYYTRPHRDLSIIKSMRNWMNLNPNLPNDQLGLPNHCR
jgi:alpha-amylase